MYKRTSGIRVVLICCSYTYYLSGQHSHRTSVITVIDNLSREYVDLHGSNVNLGSSGSSSTVVIRQC